MVEHDELAVRCGGERQFGGAATILLDVERAAVALLFALHGKLAHAAILGQLTAGQALFFPFRGIRAPLLRALLRPMAMACLRDRILCLCERMWCISVRTDRLAFLELFERIGKTSSEAHVSPPPSRRPR